MQRLGIWALVVVGMTTLATAPCSAAFFTTPLGSTADGGHAVSSSAVFTTSTSDGLTTLTITLSNNSATLSPGSILTGIGFNVANQNSLTFGSSPNPTTTLATGSALFTSDTAHTTSDLTGAYVIAQAPGSTIGGSVPTEYGISAVGGGGSFNTGSISKGGGGDDYGIVGPGTDLNSKPLSNFTPLVRSIDDASPSSVIFTLTTGTPFSDTNINNVHFLYGSNSESVLGAPVAVPEPASIALMGIGLVAMLGYGRRRSRRRA